MTDTLIYGRQQSIPLNIPDSISIVGCGGVGSWLAMYAAMVGVKNIYLYDSDTVEEHNLNRLPFPKDSVTKKKTEVMKEIILSMRDECMVICYDSLSPEQFSKLLLSNNVIDCTDDYPFQLAISKWCKAHKMPYIKAGYDGPHITITSTIPEWDSDPEDTNHYNTPPTPSFVVPASLVASLVMTSILYKTPFEFSVNIHDLKG